MAEQSYPFDSADMVEGQWSRMARWWQDYGVAGDPGGPALAVSGPGTGMTVNVAAGEAQVRGHHYQNTTSLSKSIAANASGSTRYDRVVLRLDPAANSVVVAVKQGSTSPPSLTQDDANVYEISLAQISVPNGASSIGSGNVTDERTFLRTGPRGVRAVADIASPRVGQIVYETTTASWRGWNGGLWETLAPELPVGTLAQFAGPVAPAGWMLCDGSAISRSTYSRLFAVIGTTWGSGNGSTTFNVPDLRGRTTIGAGSGPGLTARTLAQTGGSESAGLPSHSHSHSHSLGSGSASHSHGGTTGAGGYHLHGASSDTQGYHAHQTYEGDAASASGGYIHRQYSATPGDGTTGAGSHSHNISVGGPDRDHTHAFSTDTASASHSHSIGTDATSAGAGGAGANLSPFAVVNQIIKWG